MSIINDALKKVSREKEGIFVNLPKERIFVDYPKSKVSRRWAMLGFSGIGIPVALAAMFLLNRSLTEEPIPPGVNNRPPAAERQMPILAGFPAKEDIPAEVVEEAREVNEVAEKTANVSEPYPREVLAEQPEFSLTGIIWEGREGLAVINDQIVGEGDIIKEAEVVHIGPEKVVLSWQEEEIIISLGK